MLMGASSSSQRLSRKRRLPPFSLKFGVILASDGGVTNSCNCGARRRPAVCVDCRYIRERPSGIGVWVQELVDYLPGLAPDLDFVFLKHPKAPERLSAAPNAREIVVPQEANGPATMFYLPRVVDFSQIDVYHNTFNLMPYMMPIPTVVTVTDIM